MILAEGKRSISLTAVRFVRVSPQNRNRPSSGRDVCVNPGSDRHMSAKDGVETIMEAPDLFRESSSFR